MRFEHEATPVRIDERVALAAVDLLARIVTARTPASVVLTLWLSMIAAEGLALRPTRSRSAITSAWFIRSRRCRRAGRQTSSKSSPTVAGRSAAGATGSPPA